MSWKVLAAGEEADVAAVVVVVEYLQYKAQIISGNGRETQQHENPSFLLTLFLPRGS